jgi:hypothetical protein
MIGHWLWPDTEQATTYCLAKSIFRYPLQVVQQHVRREQPGDPQGGRTDRP